MYTRVSKAPAEQADDRFSEREKSAFRHVDILACDHHQATDELYDDLRKYFSERQIIILDWRISMFVGYGQLLATLGMDIVGEACKLPRDSAGWNAKGARA